VTSQSHSRVAAWTATAVLIAIAAVNFHWALGGTPSTYERTITLITGFVALAVAGVLLVRVGYWHGHVPLTVVRMTRTLGFLGLGGALAQFAAQGFISGTINLIVALLIFAVARSDLPASPTSATASTPSGKPRPPAPTH
jgi:hypothetical protein